MPFGIDSRVSADCAANFLIEQRIAGKVDELEIALGERNVDG